MVENLPFFLIILIVSFLVFLFFLFLLFREEKKKPVSEKTFSGATLTLEISDKFENLLEEVVSQELRKTLILARNSLLEKQKEFEKEYQKIIEGLRESAKLKKEMIESEKEKLEEETGKILQKAEKEILSFAKEKITQLEERLEKDYNQILTKTQESLQKEIEDYKRKQMEEIDKKIFTLLERISRKLLGYTIDLSTHEKLVLEILEKAKKELQI